ncbi:hypothetical protein BJX99DRAFT_252760 [Aspergillus californicus]
MSKSRWLPIDKFPITKALNQCLTSKSAAATGKPHFVSENLCDHVLQRLSPFLLRNPPVDILDLWPGPGVFSARVNKFLKPRRHVLIEPDPAFKPILEPLANSDPSYKLFSSDLNRLIDKDDIVSAHFPEQGPSNSDKSGALARNDTLLVIAHCPSSVGKTDNFTGARWVAGFAERCMAQRSLHAYGSVRLIVSMSPSEAFAVLPRVVNGRTRSSSLTEQVALHAFEVAAPESKTDVEWAPLKLWDTLVDGAARVAQRTSDKDVVVPVGREYPGVEPALESPVPGRIKTPYTPRAKSTQNDKYKKVFEDFDKMKPDTPGYKEFKKVRGRTAILLNQENRQALARQIIVAHLSEIDDLNQSISRLAADPKTDLAAIAPVVEKIKEIRAALDEEYSQHHFDTTRNIPNLHDDKRASGKNFDDALLLWDRRPFEPLLIHPEELYPREKDRLIFYFEADPNSTAAQRLNSLNETEKQAAANLHEAFTLSLATNQTTAVSQLISLVFPSYSTNDMVKAVPSLAKHATKRPKSDFDSLPKTLHWNPLDFPDPSATPDPNMCYQENLDYDLSDVRTRLLSHATLWDLCVEYARSGGSLTAMQLNRLLGGSLTAAQGRNFPEEERARAKKLN